VNEAFASVALQFLRDARLEQRAADVNPNGGGISLGHPLGATGARITATDDPKEIVRAGYDAIADRFAAWQGLIADDTRLAYLDDLLARLPERPDVLELGVGAGIRSSQILAEHGRLTGVDLSREQLRRAKERLPGATLVHGDVTKVELPSASFDAVVSFYVLNNLPQPELGPLLRRVAGRPRGRPGRARDDGRARRRGPLAVAARAAALGSLGVAEISRVGVVGLGTMGSGIAQVCLQAGLEVVGREVEPELGERARPTRTQRSGDSCS
jgi:hypothetical protein